MKILLTGHSGQLGQVLAPALAAIGEVAAPGRHELDLTDTDSIRSFVHDLTPQIIVNAAAYTAVDRAETEAALALAVNGRGPEVLAAAARDIGAALIHYSTDYVFDGAKPTPYRERDPTGPLNEYGRTKRIGEVAIAASGVPHLILRTTWLYGAEGSNFLRTMLRLGRERDVVSVVNDQFGAPTSVGVVAAATREILAQSGDDPNRTFARRGGVVHLCCRGETSWHGFAETIFAEARAAGIALKVKSVAPIPTREFPTPARRPLNSRLDLSRLEERFGVVPPPWRDALHAVMAEIAS